jgi:hypothetical protein
MNSSQASAKEAFSSVRGKTREALPEPDSVRDCKVPAVSS